MLYEPIVFICTPWKMLLALNIFLNMYLTLGLDPASFTTTTKFCYIDCKRMTGMMNMQTIPDG